MGNLAHLNFDASQVEPDQGGGFEPLPTGDYLVLAQDAEVKVSRSGDSRYLSLKLQVLDGPSRNRIVFGRVTISAKNETAQRIGQAQFSALCRATGIVRPNDTAEFLNKPFVAHVKYEPPRDGYGAGNSVTGYKPANQSPGQQAFQPPRPSAQAQAPQMPIAGGGAQAYFMSDEEKSEMAARNAYYAEQYAQPQQAQPTPPPARQSPWKRS